MSFLCACYALAKKSGCGNLLRHCPAFSTEVACATASWAASQDVRQDSGLWSSGELREVGQNVRRVRDNRRVQAQAPLNSFISMT